MANFVHGTAGWSYGDWVGPFYHPGTRPGDFLARYAECFPGVEIDSTFYAIPAPRAVAAWARRTPEGFLFSPKMPRLITHELFLQGCEEPLAETLSALDALGDKLGPIVLQFPRFARGSGVDLAAFLGRLRGFLDRAPEHYRFAVEVRNREFLRPALFEALLARAVALVLVDHVAMPPPWKLLEAEALFTTDFVSIRLIGDRHGIERITKRWGEVVVDHDERLDAWAEIAARALAAGVDVNAFANNHYAGHGPATANALARRVAVRLGDAESEV